MTAAADIDDSIKRKRIRVSLKKPVPPWTVLNARITQNSPDVKNRINYCSSNVKIHELHFTFAYNWRRIILPKGSGNYKPQILRVITHCLWFLFSDTISKILLATISHNLEQHEASIGSIFWAVVPILQGGSKIPQTKEFDIFMTGKDFWIKLSHLKKE